MLRIIVYTLLSCLIFCMGCKTDDGPVTPEHHGSLIISADRDYFHADGVGNQSATITALLLDGEGNPLSGQEVNFVSSSELFTIQSVVTTDSLGKAISIFDDTGFPSKDDDGNPAEVIITAEYHVWNFVEATRVMIWEVGELGRFDFEIDEEGHSIGNGFWELDLTCDVKNRNGDPYMDGYTVGLEYQSDGAGSPGGISLGPLVMGNSDRNGESSAGMAYTTLTYHSHASLQSIWLVYNISPIGPEELQARVLITLPIQQGALTLSVEPAEWYFNEIDTLCNIPIQAVLVDGQDYPVNNVPVMFSADNPFLYWKDNSNSYIPINPEKTGRRTGDYDGWERVEDGVLKIYLRGEEQDFFRDSLENEIQVEINAWIVGYEDVVADPVSVMFRR